MSPPKVELHKIVGMPFSTPANTSVSEENHLYIFIVEEIKGPCFEAVVHGSVDITEEMMNILESVGFRLFIEDCVRSELSVKAIECIAQHIADSGGGCPIEVDRQLRGDSMNRGRLDLRKTVTVDPCLMGDIQASFEKSNRTRYKLEFKAKLKFKHSL